jgi:dTMP kinase
MAAHGVLIALEGPEGVGKSTQAALLVGKLRSAHALPAQPDSSAREVIHVREPGGTPLGDRIRATLLDTSSAISPRAEVLLFLASRAELVHQVVSPALASGAIVVADRFFLSTVAYQCGGRGLDYGEVAAANELAASGVRPDLSLVLRLAGQEGMQRASRRGAADRMEASEAAFHDRVAREFERALDPEWQETHPECGPVAGVDASGAAEDVLARITDAIREHCPHALSGLPRAAARSGRVS